MPSPGRRFNKRKRAEYVEYLAGGMMRGAAAYLLGYKRHEIDGYIADHPAFELEIRDAEATATENVQEAVYQAAVTGNVNAAKLWMELRSRSRPGPAPAPSPTPTGDDPEIDALMADLDP